jgi:hypothetical protein
MKNTANLIVLFYLTKLNYIAHISSEVSHVSHHAFTEVILKG